MKDQPDNLDDPSRRLFAKSAATALVAAPLAAALVGCSQQSAEQQRAATHAPPQASPTTAPGCIPCESGNAGECLKCTYEIDGGGVTHEPPIIIGSGSLRLDLYRNIVLDATVSADPRPKKYKLQATPDYYKTIATVRVLTEDESGDVKVVDYNLSEEAGGKVLVWLDQLKMETPGTQNDEYDYDQTTVELNKPAHLMITGNPFLIETDQPLQGRMASNKKKRPHRWMHPGLGRNHFRIGRWEIRNARDERLDGDYGDNSYTIAITFRD